MSDYPFKDLGCKPGDKVKCVSVGPGWERDFTAGKEYVVDDCLMVKGNFGPYCYHGVGAQWELVTPAKFKAGDKVRYKDGRKFSHGECVATISGPYRGWPELWGLQESGLWVNEEYIELVPAPVKYTDWQLAKADEVIPEDAVVSRGEAVPNKLPVKPKVETYTVQGWWEHGTFYRGKRGPGSNYRISVDVVDGEPIVESIRMERL